MKIKPHRGYQTLTIEGRIRISAAEAIQIIAHESKILSRALKTTTVGQKLTLVILKREYEQEMPAGLPTLTRTEEILALETNEGERVLIWHRFDFMTKLRRAIEKSLRPRWF